MSIFKKAAIEYNPNLTRRIFTGDFAIMGHIKRKPDTRTISQLQENIDYFANKYSEVAKFKDELKAMNPKYLGLVSDICELAGDYELINTAIDIKKVASNGKSLFEFLMEKLPQASKENPVSLELSQAVIDNADSTASKYALGYLSPLYDCKQGAEHIKATIPLVDKIAEATLSGGYTMDYSKENKFAKGILSFISPSVKLEKLKYLSEIIEYTNNTNSFSFIGAFPFITNETPMTKIKENMEIFKKIDKNMAGKEINLTEFLEKNVNLI
jgi:hypothetical protein